MTKGAYVNNKRSKKRALMHSLNTLSCRGLRVGNIGKLLPTGQDWNQEQTVLRMRIDLSEKKSLSGELKSTGLTTNTGHAN